MDTQDFKSEHVAIAAELAVTHRPGALLLSEHPLLVHAPEQHGFEVATEDHGVKVSDICLEHAKTPDIERIAAKFGTTPEHVRQALDYAMTLVPKEEV